MQFLFDSCRTFHAVCLCQKQLKKVGKLDSQCLVGVELKIIVYLRTSFGNDKSRKRQSDRGSNYSLYSTEKFIRSSIQTKAKVLHIDINLI